MIHSGTLSLSLVLFFLLSQITTCSLMEEGRQEARCSKIAIQTSISSDNADLPSDFHFGASNTADILTNLEFNASTHGMYLIAATFCEPRVFVPTRFHTLQFLVHGATYTQSYWSGKDFDGSDYSWIAYASSQGYPTLSIDRLGNGLSDHPDPIAVVQIPAHVEVAHVITQLAKASYSPTSPLPRTFKKIIYIGHSVGSLTGNSLNVKYPTDVDATILTGFSHKISSYLPIESCLTSANVEEPIRFGSLATGYLEVTSESVMTSTFYHPQGYASSLALFDFNTRGTITVGEATTLDNSIAIAPSYTAPVLVITGKFDEIFCNPTPSANKTANCNTYSGNILADSNSLYPAANPYSWFEVPEAGHNWQLHYTAQIGFKAAHDWLASVGF